MLCCLSQDKDNNFVRSPLLGLHYNYKHPGFMLVLDLVAHTTWQLLQVK